MSVHELLVVCGINDIVGKVDQELRKATLRSSIVSQNGGEGGIAEGLGEALAERLTSAGIVAQAVYQLDEDAEMHIKVAYRRKQRTTCFSKRTVCCSTS